MDVSTHISNIEQRLLVMLVDDEEVYNSDEYIF